MENIKEKRQNFRDQALSRLGETRLNNYGSRMIVDEYNNSADIWVRFDNGNMVNCTWQSFVNGTVKDVYAKTLFGVGYIGEGKYRTSTNGALTPQYINWASMIARCYSKKWQEKIETYIGCSVAEEWHNFQNFAKFYDENYYSIDGERVELDKDILVKGNRVYSPETCVFVPKRINTILLSRKKSRGDLPIGVRINKTKKKYETLVNSPKGRIYIGVYDTPEEAFENYKIHKEAIIKSVADEYKDVIPEKVYNTLMSYSVKIDD